VGRDIDAPAFLAGGIDAAGNNFFHSDQFTPWSYSAHKATRLPMPDTAPYRVVGATLDGTAAVASSYAASYLAKGTAVTSLVSHRRRCLDAHLAVTTTPIAA
jgi:hypothetical protein